jgi:hypothetical protein
MQLAKANPEPVKISSNTALVTNSGRNKPLVKNNKPTKNFIGIATKSA